MLHPWKKKISLAMFHRRHPLPETPGVYFFLGERDEILYIGKATVLVDRVTSYFRDDIAATRGPKIVRMLERVRAIGWQPYDSVLEALLREGELIHRLQPPYNSDAKDDKSYNFVVITREKFPRVLLMREKDLLSEKITLPIKEKFGPYPRGQALQTALKIVRHIFPFRDRCIPFGEGEAIARHTQGKPCFHAQIGLCPGVCSGAVSAREYGKTIRRICLFFSGRKNTLIKKLEKEMHLAAREMEFEKAQTIKKLLFDLGHIRDVALMRADREESSTARIEAYDVAHLKGEATVGVMTVVQHGITKKSEYRLFTLRGEHGGDDLAALEEVLIRRLAHHEWTLPELLVVDGAFLQTRVAEGVLKRCRLTIPIVGVVKNKQHQPERLIGARGLITRFKPDILLANSEAHRFAIGFHRRKKRREFLPG